MSESGNDGLKEWLILGRLDWELVRRLTPLGQKVSWMSPVKRRDQEKEADLGRTKKNTDKRSERVHQSAERAFPKRTVERAEMRKTELKIRIEKTALGLKAAKPLRGFVIHPVGSVLC